MKSNQPTLFIYSSRSLACFLTATIINGFALGLLVANTLAATPNPRLAPIIYTALFFFLALLILAIRLRRVDAHGKQII